MKLRVKQKIWYFHYVQLHSEPHMKYFLKDRPALKYYQKKTPKPKKENQTQQCKELFQTLLVVQIKTPAQQLPKTLLLRAGEYPSWGRISCLQYFLLFFFLIFFLWGH